MNTVRESALKNASETKINQNNPLPKQRIESASVLRLAFWSDTGKKKADRQWNLLLLLLPLLLFLHTINSLHLLGAYFQHGYLGPSAQFEQFRTKTNIYIEQDFK